ncbi:hypothetical protein AVEN_237668-1 [Araneus ventricosus]|uniref:Mariner Mos1 transposase n=1 Tax=Araneus ventricosus TaxID=182803 RepID=A0A4Y2KE82_ARAVE|nr:hypothetical protein AVEN_237668-1 [Araneus ventricosus]
MVFIFVPLPKKYRLTKSRIMMLLIAFFDSKCLIHHEFVPAGTTFNAESYEGVLKRLLQRIRRIRPQLYQSGQWKLLHVNARPHTAIRVRQFLSTRKVTVLEHPPYSADLASADFFLFPRLKGVLKGLRFSDIAQITCDNGASSDTERSVCSQFPAAVQPMSKVYCS